MAHALHDERADRGEIPVLVPPAGDEGHGRREGFERPPERVDVGGLGIVHVADSVDFRDQGEPVRQPAKFAKGLGDRALGDADGESRRRGRRHVLGVVRAGQSRFLAADETPRPSLEAEAERASLEPHPVPRRVGESEPERPRLHRAKQ